MGEDYVLGIVSDIVGERKNIVPSDASMTDIQSRVVADLKETLNSLVRKGVLVFHRQINGVGFNLRNEEL